MKSTSTQSSKATVVVAIAASTRRGFTLIELMVVISIIAILAGISIPAMIRAMLNAQQIRAAEQAKQIVIGLRAYAIDHEGAFPNDVTPEGNPIVTANDAFRCIVPTYLDAEAVFVVGRSRFGARVDEKVEPATEVLKTGENHYSYVAGLTDTSKSMWPLVADGTDGQGTFSSDESQKAGTWKGFKGIIARVDGSVVTVPMLGPKEARYIPRFDDNSKNALAVAEYMGSQAKLLEPAQ